jgi:sugar-phosphatase
MDGLLIDSEPFWQEAEVEVFCKIGLEFTTEMCHETMGIPIGEVVNIRHRQFGWDSNLYPVAEVTQEILDGVIQRVQAKGEALPGALDLLRESQQLGICCALASSSPRSLIDAVLDRLNIRSFFNIIQSADGLPYGKPHPEVFLKCAHNLGANPRECIVFEDSLNGVIAAKAASMACIAVPEKSFKDRSKFLIADQILNSLADFKINSLY